MDIIYSLRMNVMRSAITLLVAVLLCAIFPRVAESKSAAYSVPFKDEAERQTTILVDAPTGVKAGEDVAITVLVLNGYRAPVADGRVRLFIDGHMELNAETDGSGRARFQLLSGLAPGLHHIDVSFKGRHGYRDSSTTAQLLVEAAGAVPEGVPHVVTPISETAPVASAPVAPTPAPATASVPTTLNEPVVEQPTAVDEPIALEQTQVVEEPAALNAAAVEQPRNADGPALVEAAPAAQFSEVRQPVSQARATAVVEFSPTTASVQGAQPVLISQAARAGEAIRVQETAAADKATARGAAAPPLSVEVAQENDLTLLGPEITLSVSTADLWLYFLLVVLLLIPLTLRVWGRPGNEQPAAESGAVQEKETKTAAHSASASKLITLNTSRFWQLVFQHVRTVKWSLLMAAASMVGSAAIDLITPWPLKLIFDYLLLGQEFPARLVMVQEFIGGNNLALLGVLAASIALIALLQSLFAYWENYRTTLVGYELVNSLRRELFLHFQRLSLTFHHANKRGELLYNVARDSQTISDAFTDSALSLVTQVLTMVGMFIVMFWVNWQLSLIPLITFPILLFTYNRLQKRLKKEVRKQRERESGIAAQLTENLSIMPVIQSFGREAYEAERFDGVNNKNLESGVKIARMSAALNRTVMVISEGGLATVIFFGAWMALAGQMTPGDVLIFITYVRTMYKPMRQMVKMTTKLNSAWVASQRIASVLDIAPEVEDRPDAIDAQNLRGEIEFDHVHFHYNRDRNVLRDISFKVQPGQRVALVGSSGAGKSTITSLLLRLYDPRRGAIYMDGVDLRDYTRQSLREQIGLVLQDAMLFGATIRENIAYGKPNATQREIEVAARQAHIHDFIASLPNGYDTVIGEMGGGLSGGQRQRIAIARALVKQPSILILDEPTSALDAESKALVDETINHLQKGKTIVVIAHQLSSIQTADQILVMRQGEIVERGTHHALMALDGVYSELYRMQNEFIELPMAASHSPTRTMGQVKQAELQPVA